MKIAVIFKRSWTLWNGCISIFVKFRVKCAETAERGSS